MPKSIEDMLDPILSLRHASKLLGVCPTTVRRWTNKGVLPCERTPGNQRRFRLSAVMDFMGTLRTPHPSELMSEPLKRRVALALSERRHGPKYSVKQIAALFGIFPSQMQSLLYTAIREEERDGEEASDVEPE